MANEHEFESTIVIGGAGADPDVAGALVRHVVAWAAENIARFAISSVTLRRSTLVLRGELRSATSDDLRVATSLLGAALKDLARRGAPKPLPRSAEDA